MADTENPHQIRIDAAVVADVPHLSANSLAVLLTTGDVLITLEQNSRPVGTLNLSYTVAKSLAVILGNAIADLESMSGRPIMTTREVETMAAERSKTKEASQAIKGKSSKSKPRQH